MRNPIIRQKIGYTPHNVQRCPIRSLWIIALVSVACNQNTPSKLHNPPSVQISSPSNGDVVAEGVTVPLTGIIIDNYYKDQLADEVVTWSVNGQKICDGAVSDANGLTTCEYQFSEGSAAIDLAVVNPGGDQGTAEVTITVTKNDAPVANIITPNASGNYYSDVPIEFSGTATDSEDPSDQLTVSFNSSVSGDLSLGTDRPTSDGNFSGSTLLSEGSHFLTMVVTDTTGRTGQDTATINVRGANHAPTCGFTAPTSGSSFGEGETILFEATASDADIDAAKLSVEISSDKDGVLVSTAPASSGKVQFGYSKLSSATHTITLKVTDEVGSTCTDAVLVAVGNAPEVSITEPVSGLVINEGDRVNFSATVSDVEDRPSKLVVEWSSSVDGVLFSQNASSSGDAQFSTASLTRGTHSIQAEATDSDGLTGLDNITLYVNGLPGAPTVSITPSSPSSADDLRATIVSDAVDPEGDPISYSYVWSVNGVVTAYTGNTVPNSATMSGDYWDVKVTPNDGYGDGASGSASVTISNGSPSASSATLTPTVAYTDSTLGVVVTGWNDPDGDPESYKYQWYVNGAAVLGATAATLADTYIVRGDTVYLEVTPWDGTSAGAIVTSNTLVIQNSLPTAPTVAVTPTQPEPDDTLTCQVVGASTDADGDPINYSYAWTRNGAATAFTSQTVPVGNTADGETWACVVTPDDGTSSGTAGSSSVLVNDYTAPAAPVLSGIESYRNEDTVTIQGTTEPFVDVTLYLSTSSGTTTDTTTSNAAGGFTFSETITRGYTYTFYATATDADGNVSPISNKVYTEACTPYDEYEDNTGYGDAGNNPVVDWSTLTDAGTTTIQIKGNIIDSADSDWYLIQTSDQVTSGINYYRFHATLTAGNGHYAFVVYSGGYTSAYLDCGGGNTSDPEGSGYTEYQVYQTDQGDGANHAVPGDTRVCYDGHGDYNNCTDFSDSYYVHVIRTDGALSCDYYQIDVTNGVW